MTTDVRRPVYQGSQLVHGVWFGCAQYGEDEARRRLLALWEAGAHAYRVQDGYLLAWPRARRLRCEQAPGLPLCDQDGVMTSAPLLPHERAGVAPGSAVLVFGASIHAVALDPALRIDPSHWLDLSSLPMHAALTPPPAPGAGFVAETPAPAPDVRALLGDAMPPASAQQAAFLRRVRQAQTRPDVGGGRRSLAAAATAAGMLAGGAVAAVGLLARYLRRTSGSGTAPRAKPSPSPARDWLAERMAKLALLTRVSRVLGWRQAQYLRKMLRQFEDGDLGEALRHAIALDSLTPSDRAALGTPGRRKDLTVGGQGRTAGIGLDARAAQLLRATYQRSFEMLDRAGRIDEAVFVLAELLNRRQEAVDYLERKGRLAQAAQLAETLELAPAVAVRLYVMAHDVERAVRLARLTDSFAPAVAELERRRHAAAPGLRLEWAQALAARGSVVDAATVLWPLEDERPHARAWLHAAEQAGGDLGMQGLVYQLALDPAALPGRADALGAVLYAQGDEAARARARMADYLLKADTRNEAVRRVAAELWRRAVADGGAGPHGVARAQLKKLLTLAGDAVLADDAPSSPPPEPPAVASVRSRANVLRVTCTERGLLPLEDVCILADGAYLLALGEGGVVVARGDAQAAVRFPAPAHHLVLARNGQRALALARRERVVRVGRIDLLTRKSGDWFSADLRFWADDYDGAVWNVVADERLMALDTAAPNQSVLWQVRDLPGPIVGFDQQGEYQALLLDADAGVEQWRYTLPGRRLLQRDAFVRPPDAVFVLANSRNGAPTMLGLRHLDSAGGAGELVIPRPHHRDGDAVVALSSTDGLQVSVHDGMLLARFAAADGWHAQLVEFDGAVRVDIVLPEPLAPRASVRQGHVLAWDRRGRLVDIDIATSVVRMKTFG